MDPSEAEPSRVDPGEVGIDLASHMAPSDSYSGEEGIAIAGRVWGAHMD